MIVWTQALSTGVKIIDLQHQKLIEAINNLEEAVEEGRGYHETGELLDYLLFYAEWHFNREENCMDEYRCPVALKNKQAHAEFLNYVREQYDEFYNSNTDIAFTRSVIKEINDWIVNHIQKIDAELGHCGVDSDSWNRD